MNDALDPLPSAVWRLCTAGRLQRCQFWMERCIPESLYRRVLCKLGIVKRAFASPTSWNCSAAYSQYNRGGRASRLKRNKTSVALNSSPVKRGSCCCFFMVLSSYSSDEGSSLCAPRCSLTQRRICQNIRTHQTASLT